MAGGIVCHGLLEGPDKQHTRLQPSPAGGLVCQNVSCSGAGCWVRPQTAFWANRKLYPGWPVKQRQDIRCPNHSRRAKALLLGDAGINMPALLLGDADINMPALLLGDADIQCLL